MAKAATRFAERNIDEATQGTIYGMNWMREITEQNLDQGRAFLENLLTITRKAADDIDHQSSEFRQCSMRIAEETLSNALDFAYKVVRAKEPQELAQLQNDFVSRQAQLIIDQGKELGQSLMQKADEMAKTPAQVAAEASRGRFEAA
jgi:hypothetical protein